MDTNVKEPPQRIAYDFDEFARLFGRERSWVYRQEKAGKIKTISGYGKKMVPASEAERILSEGGAR